MPSLNPACRRCGLWETTRGTVCVAGDGPKDADIIVIGEAPGAAEEKTGKPFQGESGQILRKTLTDNDLDSVYITNVVKCRPPGNRTPTPAEIKACRYYLDQEIEKIHPEYVVTLGGTATKTLFRGKAKINEVHGEIITSDKVSYTGMPTFHPAYTLRDPSKLPGFENDLRRLSELYYGENTDEKVEWNIVRKGNLDVFIDEFIQAPEFAFDLETSGLFPFDGKGYITAVAIALPRRTWVVPGFMHPEFQKYSHSPFAHGNALVRLLRLLIHLSRVHQHRVYGWNAKFDNLWLLCTVGECFRLDFDGMLAAHLLNENTANDLTSNCRTFLHVPEYDIPLAYKQGKHTKPGINYKYGAEDGTYTLRLVKIFQKSLKEDQHLYRLFYHLVMPAARSLEEIEIEGLTVDLEQMKEESINLKARKLTLETKLNQCAGRTINWNSPAQVATVIYDDLGLICTHFTAKKKPSTSEPAILDLKGKHPVIDLLIEYRQTAKFLSTYIEGFRKYMVNDKLHISYKIHGTVTGRYSSRIHSIPRDGSIRNLIAAPPGWEFAQGDISQAELRIIASLSGDLELRRCYNEDIDVHWSTLINMLRTGDSNEYTDLVWKTAELYDQSFNSGSFGEALDILEEMGPDLAIELCGDWKEARKKTKAVNFGFVYGMFEKKFIETAKIKYGWEPSLAEATQARAAYFSLYYGVKEWHSRQKRLCKTHGFVRCLSGRVRRLPGIHSRDRGIKLEAERQAINSPVQGFIGDYKAMVMVEVHETIDRSKLRIVGEHHDAILMIVKKGYEDDVLPQVLGIMRKPSLLKTLNINLHVPMLGEIELGPWGKGVEYQKPLRRNVCQKFRGRKLNCIESA